jgi:hypothetical protein
MYGQYSNSTSYSYIDSSYASKSYKNFNEYRPENTYPFDRPKEEKSYQWKIEESKENTFTKRERPVTSAYLKPPKSEFNGYSTT